MKVLRHGPFSRFPSVWAAILLLAISSCKPPTPDEGPVDTSCFPASRSVYRGVCVLNEGEWQLNTATLTFQDAARPECRLDDLFRHVNANQPLGDVAQSILRQADTLFIVMNGSARIYKLQLPSFRLLATLQLPAGASPRQLVLGGGAGQAWLSSLTNGTLYAINTHTMSVTDQIPVENYAEGIAFAAGRVFVACGNYPGGNNNKLAIITPQTESVQYITLPAGNPGAIVPLPDGRLAVECRGNYYTPDSAAIVFFNPNTLQIDTTVFLAGKTFGHLALQGNNGLLFTLGSEDYNTLNVAQLNVETYALHPAYITRSSLGIGATDVLYSLAWRQNPNRIYVTTYKGALNGTLHELDVQLNVIRQTETGVFPGTVFWVD